jgi:uncharacterized protein
MGHAVASQRYQNCEFALKCHGTSHIRFAMRCEPMIALNLRRVLSLDMFYIRSLTRRVARASQRWMMIILAVVSLAMTLPSEAQAADNGLDAYTTGDYERALQIWRPLALRGIATAQYGLGSLYEHGHGVAEDREKAVAWYRKAARQGHANAQFNLGNMYSNGDGIELNLKLALYWLRKAAEQNVAEAQFNLAMMYHREETVGHYKQAAVWYEKAAKQEHLGAIVNLGALYMSGFGVAKDDAAAVGLYRIAASKGHARAQEYLGDMYHWGRGVGRDDGKAVVWYREAAEQGDFGGLLKLAIAYRDGIGVLADPVLAYVYASHDPMFRRFDSVERSTLAASLKERLSEAQRGEAAELISAWGGTTQLPITSRTGRK